MVQTPKLKVIWLHSHFLYWMGGTKFVFEIICQLKKDFDITVIVENASPYAIENYKKENIKLISLNKSTSTSPLYWLAFPYNFFVAVKEIKKIANYVNADAVVSSMFPMNAVANIISPKTVQYCFEPFAFFHDREFIKDFPLFKRLLINLCALIYKHLDVWATKRSKALLTLNKTTSKAMEEIYNKKPTITFTGIDTSHFKPFVSSKLRFLYGKNKIIIHSTDYTPVKRTDAMINIFSKVLLKIPKAKLLITSTINDTASQKTLLKQTKDLGVTKSVEFLGFVDYKLLPQYYSLAEVLVQTSYSQKSGTTSMALPVKEALACGTPAIRFPIKSEDVIDGITGYLVDPRNETQMVEKIVNILNWSSPKKSRAKGIARKSITEKYTWKNTSDIVKNSINSIIQKT